MYFPYLVPQVHKRIQKGGNFEFYLFPFYQNLSHGYLTVQSYFISGVFFQYINVLFICFLITILH